MVPLTEDMLAVKTELCGGNRSFVVSFNRATQTTFGLRTARRESLSPSELAVQSHVGVTEATRPGAVPDYIWFSQRLVRKGDFWWRFLAFRPPRRRVRLDFGLGARRSSSRTSRDRWLRRPCSSRCAWRRTVLPRFLLDQLDVVSPQ